MHSLADWKCDSKGKRVQAPRETKRFYLPSKFHFYSAGHDPSCKLGTHRQCLMLITLLSLSRARLAQRPRATPGHDSRRNCHTCYLPCIVTRATSGVSQTDENAVIDYCARARHVQFLYSPSTPAPSACARKSHRNS